MPRGQEPAGLVEGRGDQAAVDDAGPGLVVVAEGHDRLVAFAPFFSRVREA
jgi:hypothetical protein